MTKHALKRALDAAPLPQSGNKIPLALAFTGKRQADLCAATGRTASTISLVASGQRRPSFETARAIARAFEVPVETLFPAFDEVA